MKDVKGNENAITTFEMNKAARDVALHLSLDVEGVHIEMETGGVQKKQIFGTKNGRLNDAYH